MAEHVWSVLCDKSVIDKNTNQVSLFNIVERIRFFVDKGEFRKQVEASKETGQPPALQREMHLVTWWVRSELDEPETVDIRVVAISPREGRGPVTARGTVDLSSHDSYRIQMVIQGIVYRGDGRYWLLVESKGKSKRNWREVARLPLTVSVADVSEHPNYAEQQNTQATGE